eukprot:TRINITY_DN3151_c0_g1_i1.p1 TRINITY_DN3151_c0_g1~~TRINITY_DN3151_c0_g1_i1.p1  ORF type:complete len:395 (+),score=58.94 TRINITY_DN3151_c0_g1_i1:226-1410(+)
MIFKEFVIISALSIAVSGLAPGLSFENFPGFSSGVTIPANNDNNNNINNVFTPFDFGGFSFPGPVDPAASPTPAPVTSNAPAFSDFNNDIFNSFNFNSQGSGLSDILGSVLSSPVPVSASPSPPVEQTCPYDNVASDCGNVQSVVPYVLNGQQASPSQWPSVVSIQIPYGPDGCVRHICGGVLIASKWVLSAAHCIEQIVPVTGNIQPGALIVSHTPLCRHDAGKERTVAIFASVVPQRSFPLRDLVMLELEKSFSGPYAALPSASFDTDDIVGSISTIVGWGRTEQFQEYLPRNTNKWNQVPLQQGRLQIISRKKCRNLLEGTVSIGKELFCTGEESQAQHCVGDSGSGLFQDNVVIGITIFGVEYDNQVCLPPAGFAHVSTFVDWIKGVMSQ